MALDYSPLFAPTQPSPTTRGLRFFGDALDAVVQRRQQKELEERQMRMQQEGSIRTDARERFRIQQQSADSDAARVASQANREELNRDRDAQRRISELSALNQSRSAAAMLAQAPGGAGVALARKMLADADTQFGAMRAQEAGAAGPGPGAMGTAAPPARSSVNLNPFGRGAGNVIPDPAAATVGMQRPVTPPPLDSMPSPAPGAAASVPAVAPTDDLAGFDPKQKASVWRQGMLQRFPGMAAEERAELDRLALEVGSGTRVDKAAGDAFEDFRRRKANERFERERLAQSGEKADKKELLQDRMIAGRWLGEVKSAVLDVFHYKKTVTEAKHVLDELSVIAGGALSNSAFAQLLTGRWARFGQGAGVLTESDINTFYRDMGGIAQKVGTTAEKLMQGTVPPEVVNEVKAAIDKLRGSAHKQEMMIGGKIVTYLASQGEEGFIRIPTFLDLYAPGYKDEWRKQEEARSRARLQQITGGGR
jgi:hypothetical protein